MIDKELAARIRRMAAEDQRLRFRALRASDLALNLAVRDADRRHTLELREIVRSYGYPTKELIGKRGMSALWLLAQHQDEDPEFQAQFLDNCKFAPVEQAHLTDRVRIARGQKQIFGTQFERVDGRLVPQSIEDPENVDQRRAEVGLPSLAEGQRLHSARYGMAKVSPPQNEV